MKMRSIGIAIVLIVLIVGGVLIYKRDAARSLGDTLRSVKETSQDAATTSKVKTALLLSKHVSAFGVTAVHNNLTVNPAARGNQEMEQLGDRVADLEIKTLVLDQLGRSPELKDKQIKVQVSKRIVTLDGAVDTPAQKRAVEQMALQAPGVQGLAGQLTVANAAAVPESADEKLARRVEFELYSTRALPLQSVQIRSQDGTVILSGPVTSRAEKLLAERVTQSVDGVKRVINNLSAPEGT